MSVFSLNEQVNVESRTWPGINKPGGVGKIVKIHSEGTTTVAVDVKYILGGTEKDVELQYVKKHEELDRGGRSRSRRTVMNLGEGGEEEGGGTTKPKRVAAVPASAKKTKPKGTSKAKAPPSTKRKTKEGATISGKVSKAKKRLKTYTKQNTAPASSSAIPSSDSESVVVSADESELTAPSYKPADTERAETKKQPSKAKTTTAKRSNIVPEDNPPRGAAPVANAAFKASKKEVQVSKLAAAKPMPKLKKTDKNAGAVIAGSGMGQTTLQKVHESNSRAASSFVDDIVGGTSTGAATAVAAKAAGESSSDDASTVIAGDDQSTIGGNTHSSSASLAVDTQ